MPSAFSVEVTKFVPQQGIFSWSALLALAKSGKNVKIEIMSKTLFKRTKILATIGPSVDSAEKIEELIMAGVNGCRLNCSHGDDPERERHIGWIRAAAKKKGKAVAILQDLQGPKIRLGMLQNNHYDIKTGNELILDYAIKEHDGSNRLPVQYNLASKVKVDEPIFLYDGHVRAHVSEILSDTAIKIVAENDGYIMSRKGLNLPDTDFGGDILTEKDLHDIEFGAQHDFDFVALSFVQSAADIEKLRSLLKNYGSEARIIAKIETKKAIETEESLEAIVKAADGVMVARGDMAVEAGAEIVPVIQRRLVELCREHSKICIIATQMMMSMVDSPEPTRAEVSDVANAVLQGADAVMLSDESANGKYPIETVKAMKKVILYTQNHLELMRPKKDPASPYTSYDALCSSATVLARRLNADVIVCATATGTTGFALAAQRPTQPIITVTANHRAAGQLALSYANSVFERPYSGRRCIEIARELIECNYLTPQDGKDVITAVIVYGSQDRQGYTDTIKVRRFSVSEIKAAAAANAVALDAAADQASSATAAQLEASAAAAEQQASAQADTVSQK